MQLKARAVLNQSLIVLVAIILVLYNSVHVLVGFVDAVLAYAGNVWG